MDAGTVFAGRTRHVSPAALAHIVGLMCSEQVVEDVRLTKTAIGEASVGVANLSNLMAGRRPGGEQAIVRLADTLGCDPAAISCWCDRPDRRCLNRPGVPDVS